MNNEYYDELTGLYNRKAINELLPDMAGDGLVNVLFMDLDNFKTVNDLYGHSEGDRLLILFADLVNKMSEDAFPVRLGGDEFVVVLKGNKSRLEINQMTEQLFENVRKSRAELIGFSVISVSVGIVRNVVLEKGNISDILHHADIALYAAKDQGKACCIYYEDLAEEILNREIIASEAEEAIVEDKFTVRYQPIVHMQTAATVSIDMRFMWQKADGNYWPIREYREVFEKNGYIQRFDTYMFERACEEISKIKRKIACTAPFNIMMSRLSFLSPKIGQEFVYIMNKHGIGFDDLELSIEESVFGIRGEAELISAINSMAELGFSISLTKLGYNFESIKYLPRMAVKSLRFDGYYIDNNYRDSKGGQILRTLIRMGKELKLQIVAYGVNSKEKIDFLNGCGCDAIVSQGEEGVVDREGIVDFLREHLPIGNKELVFRFKNNLVSDNQQYEGRVKGNIRFTAGVCKEFGGIQFQGGPRANNLVELPTEIMTSDSYTISMWIKPDRAQSFVSVFYARYEGGFMSLMPYLDGNRTSSFRIHEDINVDVWYDAICRSIEPGKWNHLTISYNSYNETMRYYINGRKAVTRRDVPTLFSCRDCMIGGDHFQESFEGTISGLVIHNQSRSDDEIAQMYRGYLGMEGFCGVNESFWMDNERV